MVAGDFNTYAVPGGRGALGHETGGILNLGFRPDAPQPVWEPWGADPRGGSYFFRGEWEPLDHILPGTNIPGAPGLILIDFQVLKPLSMTDSLGRPRAWSSRDPKGVSDHFPLWAEVKL